ncbi:MAG: branched-chain amino acid transport system permease protein livM, partial [Acidimicrobiaceae bacterium]|nr:branched-chain amino acid transport system permease protein livM [Acidimicrobiaceae bacterium]
VFTVAVIGGLTSIPGAVIGAVWVEGIPFLFNGNQTIRLLTSSVGLLALLLFIPGGLSELFYKNRDSFLRWVAKRNEIHVPSLLADSLVVETAQTEHAISEAVEHEGALAASVDVIRCPQCAALVAIADVTAHDHFALATTE